MVWENSLFHVHHLLTDAESHILFFDVEGLIFELHSEEYAAMSPTTLEVIKIYFYDENHGINDKSFQAHGLITSTANPTNTNEASKKISGMLAFLMQN